MQQQQHHRHPRKWRRIWSKIAGPSDDVTGDDGPLRQISDEPLINFFHRRIVEIAFVAYAALVAYMSFVPFDVVWPDGWPSRPDVALGLRLKPINPTDIVANLTIYFPLGLLACAALRRRGLWRWVSLRVAGLLCLVLSIAIEYAQRYVQSRVASWVDVTANGLGAMMGASAFCLLEGPMRIAVRRLRREARRNWWFAASKAFLCLLLLLHLRPYDVVVDVFHTAAQTLRTADPSPLAVWRALPARVGEDVRTGRRLHLSETARERAEYLLDRFTDTAGYAAAAAMLMLGMRHLIRRPALLFLYAGAVTCTVGATVTLARILLISHGLDTAHFACAVLGWPVGATIGWWLLRRGTSPASRDGWAAWRPVALGCVAVVLLYELVPFDLRLPVPPDAGLERVCLVPFYAHFHSKPNIAAYDISGDLLRYAVLAAALAVFLRARWRRAWRLQLLAVVVLTATVAAAVEAAHLTMPSRQTDITTVLLALIGGAVGAIVVRWTTDIRHRLSRPAPERDAPGPDVARPPSAGEYDGAQPSSAVDGDGAQPPSAVDDSRDEAVTPADDPLTRELIEGPTYRPPKVRPPAPRRAGTSPTDRAKGDRPG